MSWYRSSTRDHRRYIKDNFKIIKEYIETEIGKNNHARAISNRIKVHKAKTLNYENEKRVLTLIVMMEKDNKITYKLPIH